MGLAALLLLGLVLSARRRMLWSAGHGPTPERSFVLARLVGFAGVALLLALPLCAAQAQDNKGPVCASEARGYVRLEGGAALKGAVVDLIAKKKDGEVPMVRAKTDARGWFEIAGAYKKGTNVHLRIPHASIAPTIVTLKIDHHCGDAVIVLPRSGTAPAAGGAR